jgi:SAM-dependent methyltransferase
VEEAVIAERDLSQLRSIGDGEHLEIAKRIAARPFPGPTGPDIDAPTIPIVGDCYSFQLGMAIRFGGDILNAACGSDPGGIRFLGGTNLDIQTHEEHTDQAFGDLPNFVHGSVLDIPLQDEQFDTVILGEFLEHAVKEKAEQAVSECRRMLRPGGHLVLTFPLDPAQIEEYAGIVAETGRPIPAEYCPGISPRHQTVWTRIRLKALRSKTRFIEVARAPLFYFFDNPAAGWGLVWRKP